MNASPPPEKILWVMESRTSEPSLDALRQSIFDRTAEAVRAEYSAAEVPMRFGWKDSASLNAEVSLGSDAAATVEINAGTVTRIYTVFMALLSHPEFMPQLPFDVTVEEVTQFAADLLRAHLFGHDALEAAERVGTNVYFLMVMPHDDYRSRIGIGLANLALDFVLWHEAAHASRGHLALLPGYRFRMAEDSLEPAPREPPPLLRQLEYDADTCAAFACASTLFEEGAGLACHPLPDVFTDDDVKLTYLIFALWMLFRASQQATCGLSSSHPSAELRMWAAACHFGEYFVRTRERGLERWRQCLENAFGMVRDLCRLLDVDSPDFLGSARSIDQELTELQLRWPELNAKLRPIHVVEKLRGSSNGGVTASSIRERSPFEDT